MKYAEGTSVSVINSRLEIEKIILKYAGQNAEFMYMQREGVADVAFAAHGRHVRFSLPLPTMEEAKTEARSARERRWNMREVKDIGRCQAWIDQESRRRWRCLVLAIKAKLEVVESGIATFEEEFLAHIVNSQGVTVYQAIKNASDGSRLLGPVETIEAEICRGTQ